jgi:hypothetical protein
MGIASTVSTDLLTLTYCPNVSKALTFVAADWFLEVLAYCYDVAFDIDSFTEMVSTFGGGTYYLEQGDCLVKGSAISMFESHSQDNRTRLQIVVHFNFRQVVGAGWVKVT